MFQACTFIKKRLQHKCFSVKFAKLFRTPILKNICERLLVKAFPALFPPEITYSAFNHVPSKQRFQNIRSTVFENQNFSNF